ncbi:unnamed protein product, partial [Allacma fusca]
MFAAIKIFRQNPVLAFIELLTVVDINVVYLTLYDKAFRIPGKIRSLKLAVLLATNKNAWRESFKKITRQQLRSIRTCGVQ